MLAREVAEINLQGERIQVDVRNQEKAAKFNQGLGLQNLRSQANMQRLGTQINMHNNLVSAMQNTMQGQATAAQAEAQGTHALLECLGGAAATGVKSGMFGSSSKMGFNDSKTRFYGSDPAKGNPYSNVWGK